MVLRTRIQKRLTLEKGRLNSFNKNVRKIDTKLERITKKAAKSRVTKRALMFSDSVNRVIGGDF